jgi:hypothetical protein
VGVHQADASLSRTQLTLACFTFASNRSIVRFQFETMHDAIGTDAKKINAIPVSNGTLPAMLHPFASWRRRVWMELGWNGYVLPRTLSSICYRKGLYNLGMRRL